MILRKIFDFMTTYSDSETEEEDQDVDCKDGHCPKNERINNTTSQAEVPSVVNAGKDANASDHRLKPHTIAAGNPEEIGDIHKDEILEFDTKTHETDYCLRPQINLADQLVCKLGISPSGDKNVLCATECVRSSSEPSNHDLSPVTPEEQEVPALVDKEVQTKNSDLDVSAKPDHVKVSPPCKNISKLPTTLTEVKLAKRSIYTQTDYRSRRFTSSLNLENRIEDDLSQQKCDQSRCRSHCQLSRPVTPQLNFRPSSAQDKINYHSYYNHRRPVSSHQKYVPRGNFMVPGSPVCRRNILNCGDCQLESSVYGYLFVVGYNGVISPHLAGKVDSKFILCKRLNANGVKKSRSYTCTQDEPASGYKVSYARSQTTKLVVEYDLDRSKDMFQIGRCRKHPVDFCVGYESLPRHSVSRYACRILVERQDKRVARVYAAAFNASGEISLGENALFCCREGKMDGFTTNGVLVLHPRWDSRNPGIWREVSVSGYVYPMRLPEMEEKLRPRIVEESNILQDGTLIDLCGVTLMWRSPEGFRKTPKAEFLYRLQKTIASAAPQCDIGEPRVRYPSVKRKLSPKKAFVYLSCGHVVGLCLYEDECIDLQGWSCPFCRSRGPIARLVIGREPGFYVDNQFPSHVFKPCGHAASLKTVQHWSSVKIPENGFIQHSLCPFCGSKLNYVSKYVQLILPEDNRLCFAQSG